MIVNNGNEPFFGIKKRKYNRYVSMDRKKSREEEHFFLIETIKGLYKNKLCTAIHYSSGKTEYSSCSKLLHRKLIQGVFQKTSHKVCSKQLMPRVVYTLTNWLHIKRL